MRNTELANENREAYELCRDAGHLKFVTDAELRDKYTAGDQWDAKIKQRMAMRRKPIITINKILPVYATLLGEQIARRGDIAFRAGPGADVKTAAALDKLWIRWSQQQKANWVEARAFWDGIIRSRGFYDLRISFDESMRGEPILTYLNSKDVLLYPEDTGFDPDDWTGVLVAKWLSPKDISELYGPSVDDVIGQTGDGYEADFADWTRDRFGAPVANVHSLSPAQREKYRRLRTIERQEFEYVSAECFVDPTTGEVRMIPDNWTREQKQQTIEEYGYSVIRKRMRKIRWVVSVGTMTLHNSISPYRHFTPIPYFPFLIGGKPVGVVEHLVGPQDLLNKSISQELHIVAGIANSGWKVRKNAMTNMSTAQLREQGGEDGIVIEVENDLDSVEKLKPNQIPQGIDRLSYKAGEAISEISLVSDSMQGQDRDDVSGDAIQTKARRASISLSPIYESLAHTRSILARNWLDLMQQFVTDERVYTIHGDSKRAEPEEVSVNQPQPDGSFMNDLTLGEYGVVLTDVKERDSFDLEQFGYLTDMIRNGAPIPWSHAVDSLTILENRDQLVETLKQREGLSPPGEQEKQKAQLEMRTMEAQAADKEASAAVKQASAQKVLAEAQTAGQPDPSKLVDTQIKMRESEQKAAEAARKMEMDEQKNQLTLQQLAAKMQVMEQQIAANREKMELEFASQQQKNAAELQFQREMMALKLQESQQTLQIEREKHAFEMQKAQESAAIENRASQETQEQKLAEMAKLADQKRRMMEKNSAKKTSE